MLHEIELDDEEWRAAPRTVGINKLDVCVSVCRDVVAGFEHLNSRIGLLQVILEKRCLK